ncbi:uncharacterized protein F5147DRAFT_651147 [Suillus discolor]|uniref:Uncharacterized protein n=1 Tax=Suillus discolor TaxID=1912936 RepID=A0A9P7FCP9_9AGAM|nr:uncharacterized protein F5147DRAFT_651147 [Suillus discolor]KAG2112042.1 hypothetical protein F5147DRAFT_651147 [Suillus discolor]
MQEDFLKAALQDMFDAITMQDCLDGGISILMHCAGSEASETLSLEHFIVDLYITSWEYCETPEHIGEDSSALVQAFNPASQVNLSGPLVATGTQIQYSVLPTKQFEHNFEVSNKSLLAAIQIGQALSKASPRKNKSDIWQHHNADTFLLNSTEPSTMTILEPLGTKNTIKFTGTVASF